MGGLRTGRGLLFRVDVHGGICRLIRGLGRSGYSRERHFRLGGRGCCWGHFRGFGSGGRRSG